jgi:hypothetical protein
VSTIEKEKKEEVTKVLISWECISALIGENIMNGIWAV